MRYLVILLVLVWSLPALAWNVFGDACQGLNPLHWEQLPIPIYLNQEGTPDVPLAQLEIALQQSLDAWERAPSSHVIFDYRGTTHHAPQIAIQSQKLTSNSHFGKWDRPINTVSFQTDGWPEELHGARGITFALSHRCDGTLIQSDIIMNDTILDWHTTDMPAGCETCFDIQNMLTHELGHFLGIAHTDVPDATMNICDQVGASNDDCWCNRATFTCGRTLEADDLQAAAYLYPLDQEPPHSDYAGSVGDTCIHAGQCADERCVFNDGEGICTQACDINDVTSCPLGFRCMTPEADENPNSVSVCWYGEEGLGSPCQPNGCRTGICIQGKCSEECIPSESACPGNYQCEGVGEEFYCVPPEATSSIVSNKTSRSTGGCTQVPTSIGWLWMLGGMVMWRRKES